MASIGVGSLVPRVYANFRGIDATKRNVTLDRSPDMCNMWVNYRETAGKCIETRPGFERIATLGTTSNRIRGMHVYTKNSVRKLLVHAGTKLYSFTWNIRTWVKDSDDPIYSGMTNTQSSSLMYDGVLLIKDGTHFLQYNGTTVSSVPAYTPRTRINCVPRPGTEANENLATSGTSFEAVNMLSDYRINGFCGDGVGTKYKLNEESIDNTFTPYIEINGNVVSSGFTVDYTNAVITFNEAPGEPNTPGRDNVFIKYKKAVTGYANKVLQCTNITGFNNQIFFWGNVDYPNVLFFTEQTVVDSYESSTLYNSNSNFSYIPDVNYVKDGYDDGMIKAVVPGNNALWVMKAQESDTTVYYHVPQYTTNSAGLGHYDYASTSSSIARGCASKGINFGDDIVYYTNIGFEAIIGDITTEQSTAHRSTLVDAILNDRNLSKDYFDTMPMVEWEGYLLIFLASNVFLADSRSRFTNEDHMEYDWFHWVTYGESVFDFGEFVTSAINVDGYLFVGTSKGKLLSLSNTSDNRIINSYWTTSEDDFRVPQYQKTTSKKGCVVDMKGTEVTIYTKTDNNEFEKIDDYTNTKGYIVSRIKKKKWKTIQLKFSSNKPFGLYSCTLQAYVGGYVKR